MHIHMSYRDVFHPRGSSLFQCARAGSLVPKASSKLGIPSDDSTAFQAGACEAITPQLHTFLRDKLINLHPHLEIMLFKSKLINSFAQ